MAVAALAIPTSNASAMGAKRSALSVAVTVVRPCQIDTTLAVERPASVALSCSEGAPRVELEDASRSSGFVRDAAVERRTRAGQFVRVSVDF